jgi:hypothetical protein
VSRVNGHGPQRPAPETVTLPQATAEFYAQAFAHVEPYPRAGVFLATGRVSVPKPMPDGSVAAEIIEVLEFWLCGPAGTNLAKFTADEAAELGDQLKQYALRLRTGLILPGG